MYTVIWFQIFLSMTRWMAFVYVGVGMCQSEDPFVCFGAKPTQRSCARDYLWDRRRTRESSVQEQDRTEQNRRNQSAEQDSRQKRAGVRTCGLRRRIGQREKMSAFLVALWEFRSNTRSCEPTDTQKATLKCHKPLPSCAWS